MSHRASLFWLGLNDQAQEGVFRWQTQEVPGWTAWKSGEPKGSTQANCVSGDRGQGMAWEASNCGNTREFVCEHPAIVGKSWANQLSLPIIILNLGMLLHILKATLINKLKEHNL